MQRHTTTADFLVGFYTKINNILTRNDKLQSLLVARTITDLDARTRLCPDSKLTLFKAFCLACKLFVFLSFLFCYISSSNICLYGSKSFLCKCIEHSCSAGSIICAIVVTGVWQTAAIDWAIP